MAETPILPPASHFQVIQDMLRTAPDNDPRLKRLMGHLLALDDLEEDELGWPRNRVSFDLSVSS